MDDANVVADFCVRIKSLENHHSIRDDVKIFLS